MRRIRIQHSTRYRYAEQVTLLPHKLHLGPREGHDIRLEASRLEISPAFDIHWQRDIYGNSVAMVSFRVPTDDLSIYSEVLVEHYEEQPLDFLLAETARQYPFRYDPMEQVDLTPYQLALFPTEFSALRDWEALDCVTPKSVDTIEFLTRLNARIANDLEYRVREEPGVQTPAETLGKGNGSCRDFATLFIEACRCCGLASRFISGYLLNEAQSEVPAATHAWSEIYLPGAGWRGFDSTSGQVVSGDHIAVAVHRHPEAIPPVAGAFLGTPKAKPTLSVDVQVQLERG